MSLWTMSKAQIRRVLSGRAFTRHPNTKPRNGAPAIHYRKHTIRASLRRHSLRVANWRTAALAVGGKEGEANG
jgi:hypothetical protein